MDGAETTHRNSAIGMNATFPMCRRACSCRVLPGEPWAVRLWGSKNSADLGGSSNDSNGIFED